MVYCESAGVIGIWIRNILIEQNLRFDDLTEQIPNPQFLFKRFPVTNSPKEWVNVACWISRFNQKPCIYWRFWSRIYNAMEYLTLLINYFVSTFIIVKSNGAAHAMHYLLCNIKWIFFINKIKISYNEVKCKCKERMNTELSKESFLLFLFLKETFLLLYSLIIYFWAYLIL